MLLSQGVNPRVVMETLGHSQVSLTLNTYSHVLPALQQDAADKMNAVLAGSSTRQCVSSCVNVPAAGGGDAPVGRIAKYFW